MKRIIDNRKKGFFIMDDEYLNGMAKIVGHQGTLVYFSLCRHADKEQHCFPSIKHMAEQHGVSPNTIKRGIKSLREHNVIHVGKKRRKDGIWLNNSYTLMDKSVWDYIQGPNSTVAIQGPNMTHPGTKYDHHQGPNMTTKETHIEGNTSINIAGTPKGDTLQGENSEKNNHQKEITLVFDEFKKWNISADTWYKNTTQRAAAIALIKNFPIDELLEKISMLPEINIIPYVTPSTTPKQLLDNYAKMKSQLKKVDPHY